MKRREFTATVYKEIVKRATDANGAIRCEECHCAIAAFEVHHVKEDALEVDKSNKLVAKDGKLLCIPCHKELTKAFAPVIAKVNRIENKHLGADRPEGKIQNRGFAKAEKTKRTERPLAHGSPAISRRFVPL